MLLYMGYSAAKFRLNHQTYGDFGLISVGQLLKICKLIFRLLIRHVVGLGLGVDGLLWMKVRWILKLLGWQ